MKLLHLSLPRKKLMLKRIEAKTEAQELAKCAEQLMLGVCWQTTPTA